MDNEIRLISDGDGLAVIGDPAAVERFLVSEGLPSKELGLHRLRPAVENAAAIAQAGNEIVANSGRWVKMTKAVTAKLSGEITGRALRWWRDDEKRDGAGGGERAETGREVGDEEV